MFIKQCEICGNTFEATNGNAKYCSDNCREEGLKAKRKEWYVRTGYAEKQRHAMELYRAKISEEESRKQKEEARKRRVNARRRQSYAIKKKEEKITRRADAGDRIAKFTLAIRNYTPNCVEYWDAMKEYELTICEEQNRISTKTVNGISINDPDFAERVAESVIIDGRFCTKA